MVDSVMLETFFEDAPLVLDRARREGDSVFLTESCGLSESELGLGNDTFELTAIIFDRAYGPPPARRPKCFNVWMTVVNKVVVNALCSCPKGNIAKCHHMAVALLLAIDLELRIGPKMPTPPQAECYLSHGYYDSSSSSDCECE